MAQSVLSTAASWIFAQASTAAPPPPLVPSWSSNWFEEVLNLQEGTWGRMSASGWWDSLFPTTTTTAATAWGLVASSAPLVLLVARHVVFSAPSATRKTPLFLFGGSLSAVVGTLLAGPLQWLITVLLLGVVWRWPLTTVLFGCIWSVVVWLWWNNDPYHLASTATTTTTTLAGSLWGNPVADAVDEVGSSGTWPTLEWLQPAEWPLPPQYILLLAAVTFSWIAAATLADALHALWKVGQQSFRRAIGCGLQVLVWDGPRFVFRSLFAVPMAFVKLLLRGKAVPTVNDEDNDEHSTNVDDDVSVSDDDQDDGYECSTIGGSDHNECHDEWDDDESSRDDEDYVYWERPDCEFDLDEYEVEDCNDWVLSPRKSERLWQRGL